jgi:hypothetical protein
MLLLEFRCEVGLGLISGFSMYTQDTHNIFMSGHFLFVDAEFAFLIWEVNCSFDIASVMIDVLGLFASIFPVFAVG